MAEQGGVQQGAGGFRGRGCALGEEAIGGDRRSAAVLWQRTEHLLQALREDAALD